MIRCVTIHVVRKMTINITRFCFSENYYSFKMCFDNVNNVMKEQIKNVRHEYFEV